MDTILTYKQEVIKAMEFLANDPRTIFVGQTVEYPGGAAYQTLLTVPSEKKIEVPVFEDIQLGMCTGLSLMGYMPVCVFPRMDFFICAMNQLVNHLDKIEELSDGRFKPKMILRVLIGQTKPLNPGLQQSGDYTVGIRKLLKNIKTKKLVWASQIVREYKKALESDGSTILIELSQKGLFKPWGV